MFAQFSCTWPLNVSVALSVPFLNYHTQSTKNGNYSVISRLGLANGILFMGSCSITLTWVHGFCLSNTWKDYYCGCCRKHASPLKWLMVYGLFLNGEPPLYVFTSCCFHLFLIRTSKDAAFFPPFCMLIILLNWEICPHPFPSTGSAGHKYNHQSRFGFWDGGAPDN